MKREPSTQECPACRSRNHNRIPRRGLMRFLPGAGAYLCRDCGTAFYTFPGKVARASKGAQVEKGLATRQLALERREQEFAERLAAFEEHREAARMRLSRQEDAARHFQQAAADLRKENQRLTSELFELRAMNTALEARVREHESEPAPNDATQPLHDRIATLEAENDALRAQVAGEATRTAHALESFGEQETALRRELAQARGERDARIAELAQATQRIRGAEDAQAEADAAVRELREAVAELRREKARLLEQVSDLEARLAQLARRPPPAAPPAAAAPDHPSVRELLARSEEVLRRIRERQAGSP